MVATAEQNPLLKVSGVCRCFCGISSRETEGSAFPENMMLAWECFFGLNFVEYCFVKKFVVN